MSAEPNRRRIVIGPKAHELRRYVGPTSWAVLEEMMQAATGPADRLVAEVSIGSLAASLGLAKDTVARAVRRLRDLGVIAAEQPRSERGVFQAGSYRLDVPAVCLAVEPSSTTPQARRTPKTSPRGSPSPAATTNSGQLSLSFRS